MAYDGDMKVKKTPVPKAPNGGRDPRVLEKHSLTDSWWRQKKMKGDA